jgi:membrane dipeptidase
MRSCTFKRNRHLYYSDEIMGRHKQYRGYTAYQYLTPGIDYEVIPNRAAINPDWAYTVPLSKSEEELFEQILEKHIIVDLHEHPTLQPENMELDYRNEGREVLAYEALSRSGIDAIFDNMMDGYGSVTSKHGNHWTDVVQNMGMRLCDIAHQDFVIPCERVSDIYEAFTTGKLAWVPVLESLNCIENEVDRVDVLYGLGLRSAGLVYSESNLLGSGLRERRDGGLTDFGYDVVIRMNKLGMLIDISHGGDQTVQDTIIESKKPILISHCGSRTLTATVRMLPDEVLMSLAERGGVLGVEMAGAMIRTEKNPVANLEAYMEQIEYCIELLGIDHVGCGPDTMYGDHLGLYRAMVNGSQRKGLGHTKRSGVGDEVLGISIDLTSVPDYVRGMENPTECLQNITRWLVKHGYSETEIAKVIGGNAMRLLQQVWY